MFQILVTHSYHHTHPATRQTSVPHQHHQKNRFWSSTSGGAGADKYVLTKSLLEIDGGTNPALWFNPQPTSNEIFQNCMRYYLLQIVLLKSWLLLLLFVLILDIILWAKLKRWLKIYPTTRYYPKRSQEVSCASGSDGVTRGCTSSSSNLKEVLEPVSDAGQC